MRIPGDRGRYLVDMSSSVAGDSTVANRTTDGLSTATSNSQILVSGAQTGNIEEGSEYRFFMYRHWSLFDAMLHSSYVAAKLSVWNARGKAKLQELLAKMGVALYQCKQNFNFMTPEIRYISCYTIIAIDD